MSVRVVASSVAAALLSVFILGTNPAAGHSPGTLAGSVWAVPVTGTFTDSDGAGTFSGTLRIQRFARVGHSVVAMGVLSGTLTSALGTTRSVVDQPATLPVRKVSVSESVAPGSSGAPITTQQAQQNCRILRLEFGGITVNILGIDVHLDPIVLNIDLGGILGGILCGILGALGGTPVQAQASVLNKALGLAP